MTPPAGRIPRIDVHVHLAGLDGGAPGCHVSPRMRRSLAFKALERVIGIDTRDGLGATETFAQRLAAFAESATELDYVTAFALDGVYTGGGELDLAQSHLFVPNAWTFQVCRRSPKLLPVISVNPQRADAVAELQRWGPDAVALKWLGPLQKFDPSASAHARFLDALRELDLPVIAHSGCEHTFPGMAQELGNPLLYEGLLQRGIPVVFSHCGTGSWLFPGHDYSVEFVRLLERYPNAYGDTSAFASLVRRSQIRRFAASRHIDRILHGSDWPIPSTSLVFLPELGFNRVRGLEGERHPLDRDARTKRAMGLPDVVFEGAWHLLGPRIRHWEALRARWLAGGPGPGGLQAT
ncbi:MAG: amidohydrolase family protein [Candidatus Sericytochromatia bacterium]|nr:amidohydrolase family protein [Candidatus Sericytochromatia bacterium]